MLNGRWWTTVRRASAELLRARVLLLPPEGESPDELRPAVAGLPADVEVLGLTLPGRGGHPLGPRGVAVADVIASLSELGSRPEVPTIVSGLRLGALLSLPLARELGPACCAVVVGGPAPACWPDVGQGSGETLPPPLAADLALAAAVVRQVRELRIDPPVIAVGAGSLGPPGSWRQHARNGFETFGPADGQPAGQAGSPVPELLGHAIQQAAGRVAAERGAALLCLPFAGAGASFFRPWRALAPRGLAVRGLQLPGREENIDLAPLTDVQTAVSYLLPEVERAMTEFDRVGLFGHSLGALLAYELAVGAAKQLPRRLSHLFVSGSAIPARIRDEPLAHLADDELVTAVSATIGYRPVTLDDPRLRDLLLPALRADIRMREAYRPRPRRCLKVPITVLRGADDDLVSAHESSGWTAMTEAATETVDLPGGHMYLLAQARSILRVVHAVMARDNPHPGGHQDD